MRPRQKLQGLLKCNFRNDTSFSLYSIGHIVLGISQTMETDQRPDKKLRQGFTGAPAAPGRRENKQQFPLLPHSLSWGQACSLHGMSVGLCRGVRLEGWLRCFAHPLGGIICRGACAVPCFCFQHPAFALDTLFLLFIPCLCSRHPVFALGSSKVAVGIFGLFVSFGSVFAPTVVLEKTLESPLDCKEIQQVHPKGDQSWVFIGRTDAEAETPILWPPHAKS